MRKKIVAANWKMNKDVQESIDIAKHLLTKLLNIKQTKVILCPPFTSLFQISECIKGSEIALGGQNMHFMESGAFTGEISGGMLKSAGCQYVILGHSERRHVFNETNELIRKKIDSALIVNLNPIVCLGETLEERQSNRTEGVLRHQYTSAFSGIPEPQLKKIIIAYEPVWAIGTGVNATPDQVSKSHSLIREFVSEQYNLKAAEEVPVLYGGSVKPSNAKSLIEVEDVDGFLVGGASLVEDDFFEIVKFVEEPVKK